MLFVSLMETTQVARVETVITLHLGDTQNLAILKEQINHVNSVQADGDELDHIFRNYEGLPHHYSRQVQAWFGDSAKFIIANW